MNTPEIKALAALKQAREFLEDCADRDELDDHDRHGDASDDCVLCNVREAITALEADAEAAAPVPNIGHSLTQLRRMLDGSQPIDNAGAVMVIDHLIAAAAKGGAQ